MKVKKKIKKILIANRGEIAVRVIRACREMNISPVAVYSEADMHSMHVKLADEAYCIGPSAASESYLKMEEILKVAKKSGADAIHPGYGLLSENAEFSKRIQQEGIVFIGPSAKAIEVMGNKTEARSQMIQAGVPVVPGSKGSLKDVQAAEKAAKEIGFPVLMKAVSGGGGRGMRVVREAKDVKKEFESASREAESSFADGRLYMERYLEKPRHVEIQVFGDQHQNYLHFGERECSIQRRHQKIIEESPCVVLSEAMRQQMGQAAIEAAKAVSYEGAATVEFLLDSDGKFYFIEMNTRLQVEHPVTELIYQTDLVRKQIEVAQGLPLVDVQDDLKPKGHAIECRICAEDPSQQFRPCPGMIQSIQWPTGPGVRVDSYVYSGFEIPVFYDPMFAKIIVWGEDRTIAINRMCNALKEIQIQGIQTNIPALLQILAKDEFLKGEFDIHFIPNIIDFSEGQKLDQDQEKIAAIAAAISEYRDASRNNSSESSFEPRTSQGGLNQWKWYRKFRSL